MTTIMLTAGNAVFNLHDEDANIFHSLCEQYSMEKIVS